MDSLAKLTELIDRVSYKDWTLSVLEAPYRWSISVPMTRLIIDPVTQIYERKINLSALTPELHSPLTLISFLFAFIRDIEESIAYQMFLVDEVPIYTNPRHEMPRYG